MSRHQHHPSHHSHSTPSKKKFYNDWRLIVAVILMLIAMITYVLTMDESLEPALPGEPPTVQPAEI